MRTILITGATGLVGKALVNKCLQKGWCVHYLTTSKEKIQHKENFKGFYWNPERSDIDIDAFEKVSVVINLAGAPIAKRWTPSYKQKIVSSRIKSIQLLYATLKEHNLKIDQFVSASAVGYYPNSLTNYYDESFMSREDGFLVNVVRQWEQEADTISALGIPVAKIRIGMVLSAQGGALPQMVKPIKYYLGSRMGDAKQWHAWIHIDDLTRMFTFIINNKLEGVYNGTAPNSTTNNTFTEIISEVLKKPLWLPNTPAFVLRLLLGEMSQLLLEGQRVSAEKIQHYGFQFKYFQLVKALEDLL